MKKKTEKNNKTITIKVYVKPGSKEEKIFFDDDYLVFQTSLPPEKGKINRELIRVLSNKLRIDKDYITIVSGHTSRYKLIAITHPNIEQLINNFRKQID